MKKIFFTLMLLCVFAISCEHDPLYTPVDGENPPIDEPDEPGEECDPDKIYFVNDVLPIINSNCAISGCHGNGSSQDGVNFETYAGIMEEIEAFNATDSEIYEVITEEDPDKIMPPPPSSPLTSEQIAILRDWINQGATNEECTNTACDLTNVTFAESVWPIIQNNCTGCHSGGNPQGGISLTNYSQVAVIAENGLLINVVNHEPGFVAMPFNGNQLDQCSIDTLEDWVNQGYPDN
jgi:hypothetical protein